MDFVKLRQDLINKIYTDIELIFYDDHNQISINVHKVVLACSSEYFDRLFTVGKEKYQTQIRIKVDNPKVAHDIVTSFYGIKTEGDSRYLLEMLKCRSFFCLSNDPSLLYGIKIPCPQSGRLSEDFCPMLSPAEYFDLLLEVMEEFDVVNDHKLLSTIKMNIPSNYDLSNLTNEILGKLISSPKIVTGNFDYSININIWDMETGSLLNTIKGNNNLVSMAITSDNLKIVSGHGSNIKIWNMDTGTLLNTINGHHGWINCVAITSFNSKIVSGSIDRSIKIWDMETGSLLHTLNGHTEGVYSVAVTTDNLKIVSGGYDNHIKIWDMNTATLLRTLNGHTGCVHSVAITNLNSKIVSGSADHSIKIWDMETGTLLRTLNGHTGKVNSVTVTTDNLKIVSGSDDFSIKVWDMDTGTLLNTLNGHTSWVFSVAISPFKLKIVSGGYDRNIKIWDIETGTLLNTIKAERNICVLAISNLHNILDQKLIEHLKASKNKN